ncbi:MAG: peptidoglycan-binding domain-containing protein [Clostridia bacterium]|nr:peptidoglycan-binding domain-containing protein [Clostridia bacterium]
MKRFWALVLVLMMLPAMAVAESYRRGDEGSEVAFYQRELYQLGYLDGAVDGEFGSATEKAVKAFQRARGITATGVIDHGTLYELNMLYGHLTDPETLVVLGFCQWRTKSGNRLEFRTQVTNTDPGVTYTAIKMVYYCEDAYGNQVDPEPGLVRWMQTDMKLPCDERKYTAYAVFENASQIKTVYAAVKSVVRDGIEYVTNDDQLQYVSFPVQ